MRVTIAMGLMLLATAAGASEQSKRLQGRGLIDFHAGRYREAMEIFDQAVVADPNDTQARYYRAVTRARLGDYATAIDDLRAVLELDPNFEEAALNLGVALVQTERYDEAIPLLERAHHVPDLEGQASLFLGIAQLRKDQLDDATENFERAQKDPEWQNAGHYYLGLVNYREGNWVDAEDHFDFVTEASPDSAMGREAAAFLEKMRVGGATRLQFYGAAGFQYDTNVVLAPGDAQLKTSLGISDQSDGNAVFRIGGRYVPWRTQWAELMVGYEAYQSLYITLTQFNVEDHRPSVQVSLNGGWVRGGVYADYNYYLLQTNSFLQEVDVLPWVTVPESDWGRMDITYRMRRRDFKLSEFWPRDSFNHAAGARQYLYLGSSDRYVALGYQFDTDIAVINNNKLQALAVQDNPGMPPPADASPLAKQYEYTGNEVNAGVGWDLPWQVFSQLGFAYRYERYSVYSEGTSAGGDERRHDDEFDAFAAFRRALDEHIDVVAMWSGTFNNSNQPRYEYNRNIGSVGLEVTF
jgi:tetratricopeptide (TPR) repeat protein